jgi:hypothetical protein
MIDPQENLPHRVGFPATESPAPAEGSDMRLAALVMLAVAAGSVACAGEDGNLKVCESATGDLQTVLASGNQKRTGDAAGEHGGQREYRVNLHVSSKVELPMNLLWHSEEAATAIYSEIGVQLNWRSGHWRPQTKSTSICPQESRDFWIEIVAHAPDNLTNGQLAIAKPYGDSGVRIVVFYDRVESLLQRHSRVTLGAIFGYVLAHEIAHVLQGIARHSETGVLRARWTEDDFAKMGSRGLNFTTEDILLIQRGFTPLNTSAVCSEPSWK